MPKILAAEVPITVTKIWTLSISNFQIACFSKYYHNIDNFVFAIEKLSKLWGEASRIIE